MAGSLSAPRLSADRCQLEINQGILTEMKKKTVPTFDELMNPTLQALKRLGGSASIDELVPEISLMGDCLLTS